MGLSESTDEMWWHELSILKTKVFHARLHPRRNVFNYFVYYLGLPSTHSHVIDDGILRKNRFGLVSFYDRDHGNRNDENSFLWAQNILQSCGLTLHETTLTLITMPRTCGFVFNPVSFWLCINSNHKLVAVVAEVNNTFGETHAYVLAHDDARPMHDDEWFSTEKYFHVSPFLTVEGNYQFRFSLNKRNLNIWIDYYNQEGAKILATALHAKALQYSKASIIKQCLMMPMVSAKVLFLIHFQAIRLMLKKIPYRVKPTKPDREVTKWH